MTEFDKAVNQHNIKRGVAIYRYNKHIKKWKLAAAGSGATAPVPNEVQYKIQQHYTLEQINQDTWKIIAGITS